MQKIVGATSDHDMLVSTISTLMQGSLNTIQAAPVVLCSEVIALFKMGMSPSVIIHIPFGGDNHSDPGLRIEMADYDAPSARSLRKKSA